jgi:hypothetical protein
MERSGPMASHFQKKFAPRNNPVGAVCIKAFQNTR